MKRILVVMMLLAIGAVADDARQGIPARTSPSDYAAQKKADKLTIGAVQLSKEQIKNSFSSDLQRGYIVVEIGVFPNASGGVDVRRDDFALRIPGTTTLVRPASPAMAAGVIQKKNKQAGSKDIDVHPVVGVGYSTGGRDAYGNKYPGGWSTSAGVGVGVGNSSPVASTDADRSTMELELRDKILPEGVVTKPAAGYLYFPVAVKDKDNVKYALEYSADDTKLSVELPQPEKKK